MTPTAIPPTRRRGSARLLVAPAVVLALVACGGPEQAGTPARQPDAPTIQQPALEEVSAEGVLATPDRAQNAFTYDPGVAPEGALLSVEAGDEEGATEVRLEVSGLRPSRGYAVHAHTQPCGPTGAAAGPHYQNEVDPAATPERPSADPAFANPRNEIWLDLRTDEQGNGKTSSTAPFTFSDRAPASIVIHQAESTATGPGDAGSAGGRVACLNVPFRQAASG
jgi:superoxide dismutase, Cu-Zn family